jgi:hypothetical protein
MASAQHDSQYLRVVLRTRYILPVYLPLPVAIAFVVSSTRRSVILRDRGSRPVEVASSRRYFSISPSVINGTVSTRESPHGDLMNKGLSTKNTNNFNSGHLVAQSPRARRSTFPFLATTAIANEAAERPSSDPSDDDPPTVPLVLSGFPRSGIVQNDRIESVVSRNLELENGNEVAAGRDGIFQKATHCAIARLHRR